MIQIYPEIRARRKQIDEFEVSDGNLNLLHSRWGDEIVVPPVTMENGDSEYLDVISFWGDNYCHWLFDVFPHALFYKAFNPDFASKTIVLAPETVGRAFSNFHLGKIGYNKVVCCPIEKPMIKLSIPTTHCGWINPFVVSELSKWRVESSSRRTRCLIVQRKSAYGAFRTTSRNFVNLDDLFWALAQVNIDVRVVFLELFSPQEQIDLFSNADIVIGAHGAGMSNVVFCKKSCRIIEVSVGHHWNVHFAEIASLLDLDFKIIRCPATGNITGKNSWLDYGINVPVEHVVNLATR